MTTQQSTADSWEVLDSAYGYLANEEDARICKDFPDEACRVVPENFFRHLGTNVMTRLGGAVVNPKTVLAWLVLLLQIPGFVLSLLASIRESGSLLPQQRMPGEGLALLGMFVLVSAALAAVSVPIAVFALALIALAGTAICLRLPEVQDDQP